MNIDLKPMKELQPLQPESATAGGGSCCSSASSKGKTGKAPHSLLRPIFMPLWLVIWYAVYRALPDIADFITYTTLGLSESSALGSSLHFFIYDAPKVIMMLVLIVFAVGIMNSYFTPERTRKMLAGRHEIVSCFLASGLGAITPFCSCSAVPLFIGFVSANVPLGVTLSFLICAPMVNEVALVMLYGLFGFKVAALYLVTGLTIATTIGWLLGRMNMEKYVEPWVRLAQSQEQAAVKYSWHDKMQLGWDAVVDIVGKVWIYAVVGIAIGAVIHGYVPQDLIASIMGKDSFWFVPAAVLMGVPLYSDAASVIPVISALFSKGAALGSVLAFMMSTVALSLPEIMILRRVLKPQLLATFVGIVSLGILFVGYLFNWLI